MLIGHFQCECRQGSFDANLKTVVRGLESAEGMGLQILSFPEAFLTGYFKIEEEARKNCFAVESPQMERLLAGTAGFSSLFMVGFNELRGDQLYNTVAVAERGKLLGTYSKAFPIYKYFEPGRDFPVFKKGQLTFGIAVCSDTAFIEPTRILALKGAQVVFAPHFNHTKDPESD